MTTKTYILNTHDIEMCVDCALFLANGDVPESRPDIDRDISDEWPDSRVTDAYWLLTVDFDREGEEFSARRCGCCGSRDAGKRVAGKATCIHTP